MGTVRHLARLVPKKTLFLCCDVQENFRKAIPLFGNMVQNIGKLLRVGRAFHVPLIATEQYPKGLGHTAKELHVSDALAIVAKTEFTMYQPELLCYMKELIKEKPKDIVLFGIETHVNVLQTSMDFLDNDYRVHVVADCCASRTNQDRDVALHLMRQIGCFVQTSESIIFNLLQTKDNPNFKEVKHSVKAVSADMGLAKRRDKKMKKAAKKKDDKKTAAKKKPDKKAAAKKPAVKKPPAKKPPAKKPPAKKPPAKKPPAKKRDAKCTAPAVKKDGKKVAGKKKDVKKKATKTKDVKKKASKTKVAKKKDVKKKDTKKKQTKKKAPKKMQTKKKVTKKTVTKKKTAPKKPPPKKPAPKKPAPKKPNKKKPKKK